MRGWSETGWIFGMITHAHSLRQRWCVRRALLRTGKLSALLPQIPLTSSTHPRTFSRPEIFRGVHPDTRSLFLTLCGDSGRDTAGENVDVEAELSAVKFPRLGGGGSGEDDAASSASLARPFCSS
ncbi:uncharacterized protein SCHCODRAFT_02020897 [Schizophyllum commune H4-8]|uniref:uncharacterized protein n=1 Tax=Schizophyllum commune (strain H4-8 / FGSC 9210) TaxID=578458 RepID=UPI00215E6469|nr:uncharacterized protein SCHCODRAFT_02020897 [Schizophyllum commune H4-8]KAI5899796.1 hypothetical protein SCHCODRAFT_02020897 [Schizophyllum commune H4-8]